MTTEAHMFIVLLFVLTMKTDLHGEIMQPEDYGACDILHCNECECAQSFYSGALDIHYL